MYFRVMDTTAESDKDELPDSFPEEALGDVLPVSVNV